MISFVVTAVWALGIRLTDIKIFGVDLTRSSELYVRVMALVLIAYWAVMFVLAWRHDREIQKERSIALDKMVTSLKQRMTSIEETKKANSPNDFTPSDYRDVNRALEAYSQQQTRTASATKLAQIIGRLELYVPIGLALMGANILIVGVIRTFYLNY